MPVPATISLGIQTLAEVIQLAPALTALPVLRTAQNILQIVVDNKGDDEDARRLAQYVLDVAVAYADGVKKLDEIGCKDKEIEAISDDLQRCLGLISQVLQDTPKGGFFVRAFAGSRRLRRLRACEADLEKIVSLLEMQIQLRSVKISQNLQPESKKNQITLEEKINEANQETLNLIKSQVLKQSQKKLQRSSFGHFPPVGSPIFFGRSDHTTQLADSLVNCPAYHAILGPGGIGKTSVALAVLHDPRVIKVYGKHRYFLACETTTDAKGIIAGIADMFSLNEKTFLKSFKRLSEIINSNILFLLDNFETPWEQTATRQKVEELLSELSCIPNLSIVITLRGAERPGGIRWSRPFLPILGPLDFRASRKTFTAIADTSDEDPDMMKLLGEVDGIPLAITLLGAQAQYDTCASLLQQWNACKTSMVNRGWITDSRLSSLDVSISLSLTSARFTSNPQALCLLQVLSLLPDGATRDALRDMMATDFDVHSSVTTLLQVSLAYNTAHGRVCVLAPIREYVQSKHPISCSLLQPVLSYHSKLCNFASEAQWTAQATLMEDTLSECIGNIHHVIRVSLTVEDLAEEAIKSTVNLSSFRPESYFGSVAFLLDESVNQARSQHKPLLLAQCLQKLGFRTAKHSLYHESPEKTLMESVNILRGLTDCTDHLISALTTLAWFWNIRESYADSIELSREGVALITKSTPPVTCTLLYLELGGTLIDAGDYAEGVELLKIAGSCFEPSAYPKLALEVSYQLSRTYIRRDMYGAAIRAADEGLRVVLGLSHRYLLLICRASCYIYTGRYEAARADLYDRIDIVASSARDWNTSGDLILLGMTFIACCDCEAALRLFQAARQFDITARPVPSGPNLALATLELHQYHLDSAHFYCTKAMDDVRHTPPLSWSRFHVWQLKSQIHIRRGDVADAISTCVIASIFARKMSDRASVAACILWLGDAFFFIEKDVATSKACYQAFLDLMRYNGVPRWIANALMRIGVTDYLEGDSALAFRRLNQAVSFYLETEGEAWAEFCKELARAFEGGIDMENIPFFPPISLYGF